MNDCIFCNIASKQISTEIIAENDEIFVFKDQFPVAPVHYLIIPKNHFSDLSEISGDIWEKMRQMALKIANDQKLSGFRLCINMGDMIEVRHTHLHLISKIPKDHSLMATDKK